MSPPRSGWVAAVVALAVLAACEHDDMKTPIAVHSIAAVPLLTAAQTRGLVSVPWILPTSAPAGDPLLIQVPAAGCPRVRGAVVTETPAAITVQIFATITRCTGGAGGFVVAPVDLPGPLGTRTLRHGPVTPARPESAGTRITRANPRRSTDARRRTWRR